ncbi:MAG: PDZ domain-containing protein [Anaerolineales bacterium]|nr:MAG: PDZ domain-containing protein [Anaerolineales bacterium]
MRPYHFLLIVVALALAACGSAGGQGTAGPASGFEPATIQNDEGGVVTITGELTYTYPFFTDGVAQPLVILEDQAGFVDRDRGYLMPVASQVMGQITSDFYVSPFTYSISLPIVPQGGIRDVDQNGEDNGGVLVFAPAYWTNAFGDPFLEKRDLGGGGWSTAYTSVRTSEEAATEREYIGGKLLVYAPDDQQGFPSGFGADNMLFTEDDPIVGIPEGYTLVDLDTDPFTFDRSNAVVMDLLEPEGAALDDFSDLPYGEAFDAMITMMRQEYAFTELKGIDWDALDAEFRPRFEQAEAENDEDAYFFAMRDFLWSIPDGHIGFSFPDVLNQQFNIDIATGLGMSIRDTSDGRVIVSFLTPNGPAQTAGIQLGAQIISLNGEPIDDVVSRAIPWSSPFSTDHTRRLQQLRYAVRFPDPVDITVEYQNPGVAPATTVVRSQIEYDSFNQSSFFGATTGFELPVEFEVLDSGYGYVAIYSFFDNEVLTIQLWERMINTLNTNEIPGLVIDMRNNGGGFGFLADQMAAYFFSEEMAIGLGSAWDESLGDFYTDPNTPDMLYPPSEDMQYHGKIVVLVSPNCSSACEFFAHDMTIQDRATIVGHYPTGGLGGGVKDFEMPSMTVRFPIARPMDLDGNIIIEDVGVVPDVVVPVNEETLFSDGDPLLEAAIAVLDNPAGAGVVPSGPPELDSDYNALAQLQAGVPTLFDVAREEYSDAEHQTPGTLYYTIVLPESTDIVGGYYWCTTTAEELADNWAKMSVTVELNGEVIPNDQLDFESHPDLPCNLLTVLMSDWPAGEHHVVVTTVHSAALNDGYGDYPAGTYVSDFRIFVEK